MTLCFDSIEQMPMGMQRLYRQQMQSNVSNTPSRDTLSQTDDKTKQPKYHNTPTERILENGQVVKFRSHKEAKFYDELKLLERKGEVKNIRLEVQYLLQPAYTDATTGERVRAISYYADFVYSQANSDGTLTEHIVDTKGGKQRGTRTSTYAIKKKLMAAQGYFIEEK